jgi:hypothetical protein
MCLEIIGHVHIVISLQNPSKAGNFLSSSATVSFSNSVSCNSLRAAVIVNLSAKGSKYQETGDSHIISSS